MFAYHFQMSLFGHMFKKYSISTPKKTPGIYCFQSQSLYNRDQVTREVVNYRHLAQH